MGTPRKVPLILGNPYLGFDDLGFRDRELELRPNSKEPVIDTQTWMRLGVLGGQGDLRNNFPDP